jgi:hypothetical protein
MSFAGDNSYKVTYDGGSLPDMKSGTGVKLYIEASQVRLVKDKTVEKAFCRPDVG